MTIEANHSGFSAEAIFNQAIQYGTTGNALDAAEYVGFAVPGSVVGQARWLVKKLTYDSSKRVTLVQVAVASDGEAGFNNVFNNPQNLTY